MHYYINAMNKMRELFEATLDFDRLDIDIIHKGIDSSK